MAFTPGDMRTRGFVKYNLNQEALIDSGPCRLMAAVLSGPTVTWEAIVLAEATEVGQEDIILKSGVAKAWSFGPCGIRFSTLTAAQSGSNQPGGDAYIFIILE